MDFFDYLEQHPSQARDFSAGLSSTTSLWAADAAAVIDTTGVQLAVDVGGATGSLLQLLQDANPTLHGIVFDRPNIVGDAAAQLAQRGFSGAHCRGRGRLLRVDTTGRPLPPEVRPARLG
jgi:hypothetical protein